VSTSATADGGSTDPRLAKFLLDSSFKQLLEADGRGPNVLAEAAGVSPKTWGRWMSGRNAGWNLGQIMMAAAAFGFGSDDPVTKQLLQLAADTRKNNVVARPEWVRSTQLDLLVALEQVAEEIRTYELTIVPGLLQTGDYARAHLGQLGYRDAELEERVQLRLARQRIITEGAEYTAVIDEAVLHRAPTDASVMSGQLQHLLEWTALPNVTILVIPFGHGPYSTAGNGPFVQLLSRLVGRRITYVETSLSSTYFETVEANERYGDAWAVLARRAVGPGESTEMIRDFLTSSMTPR
jgi:hypothetical protein